MAKSAQDHSQEMDKVRGNLNLKTLEPKQK